MGDGLRIAAGICTVTLIAWLLHGPLGRGEAFIDALEARTQAALADAGLGHVQARFARDPLARTATLSGIATAAERLRAATIAAGIDGNGGAAWATAGSPALPLPPGTGARRTDPPSTGALPAGQWLGAADCQNAVDRAVGSRTIRFRSGSAWLNAQSQAIIRDVAQVLRRCRDHALEIGGHSDSAGNAGINRLMSQARAERVRAALIARGIAAATMQARGYGADRPLRTAAPADPANRRISLTLRATTGGD
jgi:OOP family OmpA-OmpF porin